ncbi:MAG: NifU family protein [Phycisphaeraceae bacterium]|nr:NifU family protein [Phycisphaeraceae bacterium]
MDDTARDSNGSGSDRGADRHRARPAGRISTARPRAAVPTAGGSTVAGPARLAVATGGSAGLAARVEAVLELVRPAIRDDGGDVELVEICADGAVIVRFLGACVRCPSSDQTLRNGIERQLRERIPEVSSVRAAVD